MKITFNKKESGRVAEMLQENGYSDLPMSIIAKIPDILHDVRAAFEQQFEEEVQYMIELAMENR